MKEVITIHTLLDYSFESGFQTHHKVNEYLDKGFTIHETKLIAENVKDEQLIRIVFILIRTSNKKPPIY